MDLKDFVSETLTQIVQGVDEARKAVGPLGAEINPSNFLGGIDHIAKSGGGLQTQDGKFAQVVDFDVAVTAVEGTGTKGGIGVVAGVVSLGASGQSKTENSSVSKIRFQIPLALPN